MLFCEAGERRSHSQGGYSASSRATGAGAGGLRYASPCRGVPARVEERECEDCFVGAEGLVVSVGVFCGEGVRGVEKGWAAEVEVAGGGFDGEAVGVEEVRVRVKVWEREGRGGRRRAQWRQSIVVDGLAGFGGIGKTG